MTVARAEERHEHLPVATDISLNEAMAIGALNAFPAGGRVDAVAELEAEADPAKKEQLEAIRKSEHYVSAQKILRDLHNGWVTDESTGHRWHDDLDWTHRKLHHWDWPQLPKMLVCSRPV